MKHQLKIWPEHFLPVISRRKKVEIRSEADRKFAEGDILYLREWDNSKKEYTGQETTVQVTHCLRGEPFVPLGYVAMSIQPVKRAEEK